jgi:uncharacterized membrane protein YdcZ (DUF606 family)
MLYVTSFLTVILAILARPALAVIRQGNVQLSQITQSPKMIESAALVLFGIGFLALASVVRRTKTSTE